MRLRAPLRRVADESEGLRERLPPRSTRPRRPGNFPRCRTASPEETSPYLLQHAHNPVDWYPWGEEAFAKARAENKPILLSIGYSACHWCHVMERESFEDDRDGER